MKRFLLALSLGLFVPACLGDSPVERTEDSETSPLTATSCTSTCLTRYDACLANAQDETDACLCHNGLVACELPCGVHGILEKCPTP